MDAKSVPGHVQPTLKKSPSCVCPDSWIDYIHGAYPCPRLTSEEAAEPPLRRCAVTGCQMIQQAFCLSTLSPHTLRSKLLPPVCTCVECERETAASCSAPLFSLCRDGPEPVHPHTRQAFHHWRRGAHDAQTASKQGIKFVRNPK